MNENDTSATLHQAEFLAEVRAGRRAVVTWYASATALRPDGRAAARTPCRVPRSARLPLGGCLTARALSVESSRHEGNPGILECQVRSMGRARRCARDVNNRVLRPWNQEAGIRNRRY